jgi:hypothetical protein
MKLPKLFRKDGLTRPGAQEQAEKLLVESFRTLASLCARMADFLEAQRLTRAGYEQQGKFLERLDRPEDGKRHPSSVGR